RLEKTVHEMLARLLAVRDDLDAGVFLGLEPEERGVALGLCQLLAAGAPGGPKLSRFGEPPRLRQAAGNRRLEHGAYYGRTAPRRRSATLPFRGLSFIMRQGRREESGQWCSAARWARLCRSLSASSIRGWSTRPARTGCGWADAKTLSGVSISSRTAPSVAMACSPSC